MAAGTKITKISTITGCSLLFIMAFFHGRGIHYIGSLIEQSNTEPFVKEIFPVLFAHPSIQLFGLASLGIVTLFMRHEVKKILFFIAIMVFLDVLLAFYLHASIPGGILLLTSCIFGLAGVKWQNKNPLTS